MNRMQLLDYEDCDVDVERHELCSEKKTISFQLISNNLCISV